MNVVRSTLALAALTACASAPAARAAAPTAAEILQLADHAASDYADLSFESKMKIFEPGAAAPAKEISFITSIKGDKRLIRFLSPADLKGMGMLIESRDVMYAFLPGFNRIRRLGTHMKSQTLFGSDVSNEETSSNTYAAVYTPRLVGEEGPSWVLELTLNTEKEAEFPKLKMWVDKANHYATKIESFDAAGKGAMTQTRLNFTKDFGDTQHYTPATVTFVDHRRNDHRTEIWNANAKANQKLSDDLFSQRNLARGN